MAFQEKSAWIMIASLIFFDLFYFVQTSSMSFTLEMFAPPTMPTLIVYTIILAVVSVFGNIVIMILLPKKSQCGKRRASAQIF
ncbi:MAG: uncharacterized membrane protein (DUF485 family) [Candidatus Azotimanducaceae bacterium]|jgi:uncharacterized membrane protein (DUF485 family)